MKGLIRKAAFAAALVVLFLLLVGLFVYYRYPWDNLKVRLADELSTRSTVLVKIGELKPSVPVSLKFEDIEVYQRSPSALLARIDELVVDPSIWSVIVGKPKLRLKGYAYGGSMSGRVKEVNGDRYDLDISLHGIVLDKYNWNELPLGRESSIRLGGILDFVVSGTTSQKLKDQDLSGSLNVKNLALTSSTIAGVEVPDMTFPSVSIPFEVKGPRLIIKPTSISGSDLEARIQGSVNLVKRLERSTCDIEVRLKLKGKFKDSLDPLLQWVKSKDAEGFYRITISGQIRRPRFK